MHGPTCTFWANLTPFSLKVVVGMRSVADVERNVAQVGEAVPEALWAEAQARGLLRPELRL